MARRFVCLLLVILTFQFSWSVASAYCMHETGRAAVHFGHHDHHSSIDELATTPKDQPAGASTSLLHDAHCCSVAHVAMAPRHAAEPLVLAERMAHVAPGAAGAPASAFLSPPERPQWTGRA